MNGDSLRQQLLIAMPQLDDPHFHQTVTWLIEHGNEGAMGVVINRPMGATMNELLGQLDIDAGACDLAGHRVVYGGPMQANRGFVIHRSDPSLPRWKHSTDFDNGITLASSRDVLEAIANGTGPRESLVALGYAGWGAGQLEGELRDNAWLAAPLDSTNASTILFDLPFGQRWSAAARSIGVDLSLISTQAGHA